MLFKHLFKYWTYQVFSPGTVLRERYEAFKSLLKYDKQAHEWMAELEEIYHRQVKVDLQAVEHKYDAFSRCIAHIIDDLERMCPSRYLTLRDYYRKFDFYIRFMFAPLNYDFSPPFTLALGEITADDLPGVGGKAFNLARIGQTLGLPMPRGFVVTTSAFYYFLEFNDLKPLIDEKLAELDINDPVGLEAASEALVGLVMAADVPPDVADAVTSAYDALCADAGRDLHLAVRSSALGEDAEASFAGQYRSVLNVERQGLLAACQAVVASKYSPEALYYRINYGLSDFETPMAVLALEMVDARSSGVVYTEDLEEQDPERLVIHSVWGLGDLLVGGAAAADTIKVRKTRPLEIASSRTRLKPNRMVAASPHRTETRPVRDADRRQPSLDRETALALAEWALQIEELQQASQDIEWSLDRSGQLYLLQARPLRTGEAPAGAPTCTFEETGHPLLLSGGERASSGIGAGAVFVVRQSRDLEQVPEGAVLVARHASPVYARVMGRLSAVVTDTGSTAGHFASVAREFGVPALLNTETATARLLPGATVTVDADGRQVFQGRVQAMLESPCARRNLLAHSPLTRKLRYAMSFISPLNLVDPAADDFTPASCRSLHDILRFAHEKAVQEMFAFGDRRSGRMRGAKKFVSDIPMAIYVLDVGRGLKDSAAGSREIGGDDLACIPLLAVWKGLSHPAIRWSAFSHFDWAEFDNIVMSGGVISKNSRLLASYAVVSQDYLNFSLRFGYHFVILDTLCSDESRENYILFRFSGGGGDLEGRSLRAAFLRAILERIGLRVECKVDLVGAQLQEGAREDLTLKLDLIGRLLGATRLMDMYLKPGVDIDALADDFMNGRYHFATLEAAEERQP